MTLDELLLEWSYRSEKGYPTLDNPSDISLLKQILKELELPTNIVENIQNTILEEEEENTDDIEDKKSIDIDCDDVDEEELSNNLKKSFPNYSEEEIQDIVRNAINQQCKIPVNKAIQSKDWVINKKGKIDNKQLDEYTEQILSLSKNLSQQDQKMWVNYLNNPKTHIPFKPTIGSIGNLLDDLSQSKLPQQLLLNLMSHTGRDSGGKGVGAGEFGMSLIFSNIKASIGAGDLSLDGEEFEIKGQNATLGKRPDEVNALALDKLAEFIDELDDNLMDDDNVELKPVNVIDQEDDIKLQFSKPKGARTNVLIYKNREYKHTEFAAIISDIYKRTPNKEEFKQAFKESIGEIEKAAKQMHAEAVEQFWPQMKFDTSKDVQDSIALLNFYRYILKEGFTKFLAHDIGAGGKGIGNYVYAEGNAMDMTLMLMEAGATFQAVKPTNMKPRIGFGGSFREEIS
jgi:hypothetical protein